MKAVTGGMNDSEIAALATHYAAQAVAAPSRGTDTPAVAAPTLNLLHAHQVWRDELPDRVDPSAVEVVSL